MLKKIVVYLRYYQNDENEEGKVKIDFMVESVPNKESVDVVCLSEASINKICDVMDKRIKKIILQ